MREIALLRRGNQSLNYKNSNIPVQLFQCKAKGLILKEESVYIHTADSQTVLFTSIAKGTRPLVETLL